MTASGTVRQRTPHGQALRRLVSRHPVATFLLMVFVISVVVSQVPVLTRRDILPFGLALSDSVGPVLGVAVPAFLVVAAASGREGVRELASRSLRWRAGLRWYAFAFVSVPAGVLLCVGALYGRSLVVVLTDRWTALFTAVAPHLAILIICCIVAEEVGFMGFLQARWQDRFGPVKASLLVTIPFAVYHLPGLMVDSGLGLAQLHLALAFLAVMAVLLLFGRVVMMWLYNVTGSSVLLVGLWHASFDVTTTAFRQTFAVPGGNADLAGFWIPSAVVVVLAVLVFALTRARLAHTSPGEAGRGQRPPRQERTASTEGSSLMLANGDRS